MTVYSYPAVTFRPYPEFRIAVPQGRDVVPRLDIVHTHSPFTMGFFGWRVARWQRIPRVTTFHTLLPEYIGYVAKFGKNIFKPVVWRFCRVFYNRHSKIIAPSKTLKKVLRERGIRKPIAVIPSGIDTSFFKPVEKKRARRRIGVEEDLRVFLSLGRLGYEKNIPLLLKAFKDVDGKLIVAGTGPAEKKLKKLKSRLGLGRKVSFVGRVPEKLKPIYYSAADAFVIASTSETQALVVAEAMACGCPVIGVNSSAIPEFVRDGENGYLFRPGRVAELSKILQNFAPSGKMRLSALRTGREFSVEKCVDKLEGLYETLL
jgi:glycosyltransferase involved in cell wall biosynthesis